MVTTPAMLEFSTRVVEFSFLAAILFMLIYTLLAPWYKSELGWARISLDFGIAVALSPTIINRFFDLNFLDSFWAFWYQVGAVAFVGCVSLWNTWIVMRRQVRFRRLHVSAYKALARGTVYSIRSLARRISYRSDKSRTERSESIPGQEEAGTVC
jgi:hypothetical protein